MSLRVGVNLFSLTLGGGGMRQYVQQLLPWLLRLSDHSLVLFHGPQGLPSLAAVLRRLTLPQRRRVSLVAIADQDEIFGHAHDFDVFFCPLNCLAPDLLDRPVVATLADVQERFLPQYFTPEQLDARAQFYPHTAHAVSALFTLSEFSKKSICEGFGVPPGKVEVIRLAPNDELVDAEPVWPPDLAPLPRRYVFYPANLYPHKNHVTLLDALALLRDRGVDCAGVFTGQPTNPGVDLVREAAARGLEDRVVWLGHVAPPALRYLYENAVALAFPSRFEGFGMPLVEAMLCGCPVVATAAASVPEVAGGAALLVEPTAEAFADAVARLLDEPALADDLRARGRAHAQGFTARALAEHHLATLDAVTTAFAKGRVRGPGAPGVSYVVRPGGDAGALARTLASLAFEVIDHDEVLVLADAAAVGPEAHALAGNLGVARFADAGPAPDAWLDHVRREFVWVLHAGDRLTEGATAAAVAALQARPDAGAAVGYVLGLDGAGRLAGVRYRPTGPGGPGGLTPAVAAAVCWRRPWLLHRRAAVAHPAWPGRALAHADGEVAALTRVLAYVELAPPAFAPPPPPRPRALGRLRRAGGSVVRRLPPWLQRPVTRLYDRVVRPYLLQR